MNRSVSLHPYFKVHPGHLDAVKALLREFVAKTQTETKVLNYEFTLNGDVVFCREAYADAEGVLTHLANVAPQLSTMMQHASVLRVEVHGPASELAKLKAPLAAYNPDWFEFECGITR